MKNIAHFLSLVDSSPWLLWLSNAALMTLHPVTASVAPGGLWSEKGKIRQKLPLE